MRTKLKKLIRITTVPESLGLFKGQPRYMSNHFEVIGISSQGKVLDQVSVEEGIRVQSVNMTRTISPFKDLLAVWHLYKIFKREKPFIVHTHTPKAGTVGMFAAYLAKVPNRLHTVAGIPLLVTTGAKRRLLELVEKLTYACATRVFPNSHGLADIIVKSGYASAIKLQVIGNGSTNGVNTSHFNPALFSNDEIRQLRSQLSLNGSEFIFLFLGRLVKDKGVNELIAAFKIVNRMYPNTRLLLLGSYERELDPVLAETESEINSNPDILPLGFQSDVRPYLALADVLTFPSYREGFPNVVMQAGAMEVPCIVTDINGCNEIIVEGKNGCIIPVKNTEALVHKMIKMFEDREYLNILKRNARDMICTRYEQKGVWEAMLSEYKKLENNV